MDESQVHYAEWKKPDTGVSNFAWFHLYEIIEKAKLIYGDRKQGAAG